MKSIWIKFIKSLSLVLALTLAVGSTPMAVAAGTSQQKETQEAQKKDNTAAIASAIAGALSIAQGMMSIASGQAKGPPGMPEMMLGALQVMMGMLGLMAAKDANKKANQNAANASNLSSVTTSSLGTSGSNGQGSIKIDPSLLRESDTNNTFTKLEDHFGIPREKFVDAVLNDIDPRELLTSAPKGAVSASDVNKAFGGANALSAEDKAALLAKAGSTNVNIEAIENAYSQAGAAGGAKVAGKKSEALEEFNFGAQKDAQNGNTLQLSPEVQAALAAREAADNARKLASVDESIFQAVRRKYQEKTRMIFGYFDKQGVGDVQGN